MHEATPAECALASRLLNDREKEAVLALAVTETHAAAASRLHISVRQFERVIDDVRAKLDVRPLFALGAECQRLGLIDWEAAEREREREREDFSASRPLPQRQPVAPTPLPRPAPRPRP